MTKAVELGREFTNPLVKLARPSVLWQLTSPAHHFPSDFFGHVSFRNKRSRVGLLSRRIFLSFGNVLWLCPCLFFVTCISFTVYSLVSIS